MWGWEPELFEYITLSYPKRFQIVVISDYKVSNLIMSRLSLAILGPFQATLDSQPIHFRSWKERALLAYLATEYESLHDRSHLVALLWSNMSEAQGLTNLRLTLSRLRHALHDTDEGAFIIVSRTALQWNSNAPAIVDIQQFRRAVEPSPALKEQESTSPSLTASALEPLRQGVIRYRSEFLIGLDADADKEEPFTDWMRTWRERLHQQALTALYTLAEDALHRADYPIVEQYAYRQLALERWREEAHRQLMQVLAQTGQRSAALRQYDLLEQLLEAEMGVSPDPATTLLYQQIREGHYPAPIIPAAGPPSPTPAPPPAPTGLPETSTRPLTNLPTPLTPFVGRESEQKFILNRIRERGERFVTLVGEGGVGKSRLATTIGHQLLPDFPQGVWWVSLAEVDSDTATPEEAFADCIARTFNLPLNGQVPAPTQLFTYLQNKQLLLILDNFETIYVAAPSVFDLLQQCPQVTVLITSRESLHYQAEVVLRVDGLPLPAANDPNPLAYSSMRLLIERAERTSWEFEPQYIAELVQLCRFLRGVPLALELAAPLVGDMSLPTLLDELQQGYDLLATTMRDIPPRHRTMQAIFETSWELLAPRHQAVLAQLATFRGHFDHTAAHSIALAEPSDLNALTAKSLIRRDSDGWFSLHDHLQKFAQRQWYALITTPTNGHTTQQATAEAKQAHILQETPARHAAYYLDWLATIPLYGDDLPATLEQVQTQRANLYQAWQWAVQQEQWGLLAPAIAPLRRALHIMADLRDGVRLFESLVAALPATHALYPEAEAAHIQFLSRVGQTEDGIRLVKRLLALPDLPPARHADLLLVYADMLVSSEPGTRTDMMYQQAISLAQQAGDPLLEVTALVAACSGAWLHNNYPLAQRYADTALPLARAGGDLWAEVVLLNRLGVLAISQQIGLATAHTYFTRGIELARLLNDRQTEGTLLGNLGIVAEYRKDFAGALDTYHTALALQNERGNQQAIALSHINVGRLRYIVGQYAVALPHLQTALKLYTDTNNRRGQGLAHLYVGATYSKEGERANAYFHLEQSTEIFRSLQLIPFLPFALTYWGEAFYFMGDYAHAESLLLEAAQIRRDINDDLLLKDTLALLVQLYITQGNLTALPPLLAELAMNIDTTDDVGAEHLLATYAALYEGQRLLGNPAAADTLRRARAIFADMLALMPDPAMRAAFSAIPAHRVLIDSE